MKTLRLLFADQLSPSLTALSDVDAAKDVIMLCEVMEEASYVPHHPQKIAFLFAAMRQFAQELREQGLTVHYCKLDDPHNTGHFTGEVARAIATLKPDRLIVTEPSEYRVLTLVQSWQTSLHIPVTIRPDDRFLASHEDFSQWAQGRKQLRMEFFYRDMRKKYKILIDEAGGPTGGEWNYDKENRKPLKKAINFPPRLTHTKSAIVEEVLSLVHARFSHHFGRLDEFNFAVSREDALKELDHFITHFLPFFGDYQDAMLRDEPYLYHSRLSAYLNCGLLLPLETCLKAQDAFQKGLVPLNAAEGFIRQILGWREFIRGIYWHHMPKYGTLNSLTATRPLPDFFWSAQTDMACLSEAVRHTRDYAYSHHIQRLMVTGNFALLAGLDVKQVQDWYLAVYADAFEWVEMPNTLGMALFGDGGIVASKPYAASGKYIHRMGNYCSSCSYDPELTIEDKACPFNALYWDFLQRHESRFRKIQRLAYVMSGWDRFTPEKKAAIEQKAKEIFARLDAKAL
jgi:deoxyribodipyrimidine photolyase-related protein